MTYGYLEQGLSNRIGFACFFSTVGPVQVASVCLLGGRCVSMFKAFRSFDQIVRVAGHLGLQVPFLEAIGVSRFLHDLVHEPLLQAVKCIVLPLLVDVELPLPGCIERGNYDAPWRDTQDIVYLCVPSNISDPIS